MADRPVLHGIDHRPGGMDPSPAGPWHLVGGTDVFAGGYTVAFINGANAAASASSPSPVPLRFRLAVGAPNVLTYDYTTNPATVTGVSEYTEHQVEIQGDVTNVSIGDIVFVLPIEYRHDHDVPCKGHDDAGNYVACRLLATGEFMWGVP